MPKAVEDIPEAELRELVSWFRARGGERRRLLKRYRAGRLKTEALDAKKKVGCLGRGHHISVKYIATTEVTIKIYMIHVSFPHIRHPFTST